MANIEKKLAELGIALNIPGPSKHPILRCKQCANLLFVSGHISNIKGKLGDSLSVEQGYEAAREAAVHCLEAISQHLRSLDKVKSILKVFGMVNSAPDFTQQAAVINGASELLIAIFGDEIGYHARSAVGMCSLPAGIAVELEMIVEVES